MPFCKPHQILRIGVLEIFVRFIEICVIPYSSINQPIAFTCFKDPGVQIVSPFLSFIIFPVSELFFLSILPFSLTSKAIALALLVDVVFKFMLYAIRKSLAPMAVAPDFLIFSNSVGPKSGFHFLSVILLARPSYSPL